LAGALARSVAGGRAAPAAARLARGRRIFRSKEAQCIKCHGQEGRSDGQQNNLYDDWNKGIFHGGSRPIDLYWRICVGIKGTPMPAAGPGKAGKGALSPAQIWDLATYVRWLAIQAQVNHNR
jgi:mono/diheme cytochrome c family protein